MGENYEQGKCRNEITGKKIKIYKKCKPDNPKYTVTGLYQGLYLRNASLHLKLKLSPILQDLRPKMFGLSSTPPQWAPHVDSPGSGLYWQIASKSLQHHHRTSSDVSAVPVYCRNRALTNQSRALSSLVKIPTIPRGACDLLVGWKWPQSAYKDRLSPPFDFEKERSPFLREAEGREISTFKWK